MKAARLLVEAIAIVWCLSVWLGVVVFVHALLWGK